MLDWGFMDDMAQVGCPQPAMIPSLMAAYTGSNSTETNHAFLPKTLLPKAILEGGCEWWGNEHEMAPREDQFVPTSTRPTAAPRSTWSGPTLPAS